MMDLNPTWHHPTASVSEERGSYAGRSRLNPGWILILSTLMSLVLVGRDADGEVFFENRIRPLLAEHCHSCHSAQAEKVRGGLRLDTRAALLQGGDSGPAVVPGDPEHSRLILAVRGTDPDHIMPPAKEGRTRLPAEAVANLTEWVRQGAWFPPEKPSGKPTVRHWAFEPIRDWPAPATHNTSWSQTTIDAFILADLESRNAHPTPQADRRTLIRRATLDLTGLPPTPAEIDSFLADTSPEAWPHVVDRLLASPHYGERAARHWLDVVRYADTAGETADYPVPDAWRYRNYVVRAFNADTPYDEFVRDQIAGDILAREGPRERYADRVTATGFLALSRRFGFDSENYHHLTLQDTIDTLGQAVMGLSLGCARCHNHKYDPIPATDYYALYGIFESTLFAFPGSEQKQKRRTLVPLVPPSEAQSRWRDHQLRVATLVDQLRREGQSTPPIVLRSLDGLDGDFEMQAPASGGSRGVLVQPWLYEGPIAVTAEAQSPFKHAYALGVVGAQIPGGTNVYRLSQALPPGLQATPGSPERPLSLNLEFLVETNQTTGSGTHRFWLGPVGHSPTLVVLIGANEVRLRVGDRTQVLRRFSGPHWQAVQIRLDPKRRVLSGRVGSPTDTSEFADIPIDPDVWAGLLEIGLDSPETGEGERPGLRIDNIAIQTDEIPPISLQPMLAGTASEKAPSKSIPEQIRERVGLDGDLEFQEDGKPPVSPWNPGPNSEVRISRDAQSPLQNHYPFGTRGIRLPNSGAYNGFGLTLPQTWTASKNPRLSLGFEFRCTGVSAGSDGSWRFYAGHGGGTSAALELFITASQLVHRRADGKELALGLKAGGWYQVQLDLDLQARTFRGTVGDGTTTSPFSGSLASGWDGTIDYLFIDSYGHVPGVKPGLDADNFILQATPLPPAGLTAPVLAGTADERRQQVQALRAQMTEHAREIEAVRRELDRLLAEGPMELAYGVVEGTPHDARFQQRGEPEKPGDLVPRGFLKAVGGGRLPETARGSGRLELAQWLTRPEHPLTARVMVNRIWQQHFGNGLVKTPNDFGTRGQKPTHPELLDHLTYRFVTDGWSVKSLHRLILLSATYQQSTRLQAPNGEAPMEQYVGFTRRRLTAEEIRDGILAVSGDLDLTPGQAHPFPSPISWGYTQHGPYSAVYDHDHRSLYLMTQRLKRHPFLALFDGADPNASTPQRGSSTVPTQSLYFLNDPFVHRKAERLARDLIARHADDGARFDEVLMRSVGRPSSEEERLEFQSFLDRYRGRLAESEGRAANEAAWAAVIRVVWGGNEFLHVD